MNEEERRRQKRLEKHRATINEITEKMRAHDHFYEYSEDQRVWRKGADEIQAIMPLLVRLPHDMAVSLVKQLTPVETTDRWLTRLGASK